MAKTPRTRNPEQTRSAWFYAATNEFAQYGFDGARVDRPVQTTRCSIRMLYHYFQSMETLYLEARDWLEAILRLARFTREHIATNKLLIDITWNVNLVGGRFIKQPEAISKMPSPLVRQIDAAID